LHQLPPACASHERQVSSSPMGRLDGGFGSGPAWSPTTGGVGYASYSGRTVAAARRATGSPAT